jgi:hypothetical protein
MRKLSAKEIADAFALSRARGADLLVSLAGAHVWQGSLSAMRSDDPRVPESDVEDGGPNTDVIDVVLLSRAIEILSPSCRSALESTYARPAFGSVIRDGGADGRTITKCEEHLREIVASLETSDVTEQVPKWVLARENGQNAGHPPG